MSVRRRALSVQRDALTVQKGEPSVQRGALIDSNESVNRFKEMR